MFEQIWVMRQVLRDQKYTYFVVRKKDDIGEDAFGGRVKWPIDTGPQTED
jgi:hypothetical protein